MPVKTGMMTYIIGLQVACFRRIPATSTSAEKWLYLDTRRPHTHDVRAMVVLTPPDADSLLLTGANDAQLFAYSVPHFQTVRLSKCCTSCAPVGCSFLDILIVATAWPQLLQSRGNKKDRSRLPAESAYQQALTALNSTRSVMTPTLCR